jgi:hypothetical protein
MNNPLRFMTTVPTVYAKPNYLLYQCVTNEHIILGCLESLGPIFALALLDNILYDK